MRERFLLGWCGWEGRLLLTEPVWVHPLCFMCMGRETRRCLFTRCGDCVRVRPEWAGCDGVTFMGVAKLDFHT